MPVLIVSVLIAAVVAAQTPSPAAQAAKPKDPTIQVRGCLHGQTVTLTEDPGFDLPGRKLDLRAERRLMRALREHDGHVEEFVGVLKNQNGAGPVLELRAFSHVGRKCQ